MCILQRFIVNYITNVNVSSHCKGYEYYDKDLKKLKGYPVELMDLYKDEVVYSVKKGSASSNLSYVVEQCITGMNSIRKGECDFNHEIKKVCIWLILERENDIHDNANKADLNQSNMIILKNRLVKWKKKMIEWGYEPFVRINYKRKSEE